jgi:NhaC family Na+:H+ antiporter
VPWNTCGAYISGVLGVPTASYFPFCFFNFLSPVLDVLFGFIGFKVPNATPEEPAADEPAPEDVRWQTPVISEGEDHHG